MTVVLGSLLQFEKEVDEISIRAYRAVEAGYAILITVSKTRARHWRRARSEKNGRTQSDVDEIRYKPMSALLIRQAPALDGF